MIQVKEFIDTDNSYAEKKANEFLSGLSEDQVISIQYGSIMKKTNGTELQRSSILVVFRTQRESQK